MTENQLKDAVQAYNSLENKKSLRKIAVEFGVPWTTLRGRVNGAKPKKEAHETNQALSKYQELLLEGHLIFMAQKKVPLSRLEARKLAGKLKGDGLSSDSSEPLSDCWLNGFLSRCKYLDSTRLMHLDMPRVRQNDRKLIALFFDQYNHYINAFKISPDDIWSLDEAGFKIGESTDDTQFLDPKNDFDGIPRDSSELVTALELISRTGKTKKPLLIYKGVDQMLSWFPGIASQEHDNSSTSPTDFRNEPIFYEWFSEHFPSIENKWSLLLLDSHLSYTSDRVITSLIEKKIIPLYFPTKMNSIIQPLDRSCFGNAKARVRSESFHNFGTGLSPAKAQFLEAYLEIRDQVYSPETIINGWKRCGLLENNPDDALAQYKKQFYHDNSMSQDLALQEPANETEDDETSSSESQTKRKMRKRNPKITREQVLLKKNLELKKKNRKLQADLRQARRIAAETTTLHSIAALQLIEYKNELEEEKKKNQSKKRSRTP